jgi:hypothetical protein
MATFQVDPDSAAAQELGGDNPALERHFSVQQIAEMWNFCENSVRALFKNEPGVVQIERPRSRWKRGYSTLRIPQSVLERVHRRMSKVS